MSIRNEFDFLIQWHITERCNLRCRHCYQEGAHGAELSFDEIREVLDEIVNMFDAWRDAYGMTFSPSFNITGGEPFLRKDLLDILRMISEQGYDIYILTNGVLVTKERARALADLGIRGVQVSIEGTEEVHDSIRGKGSFAASARGIDHLLDAGLAVNVNATLSALNADSMEKIAAFASHAGVRRVGFSRLVPSGQGESLISEMLTAQQVKALYESLFSLGIPGLEIVTGDPVAMQTKISLDNDIGPTAVGGCAAGVSGLTLLSDGTIVPCRRLNVPLGNVRTDSLREVWAASPVLEALRDRSRYSGRCGKCKRWANCRGCRAIAWAWSRSLGKDDFLADDPQCFL